MSKDNKVKKSLKVSFWDGVFASVMTGLTQDYITPYALTLKATVKEIGFLSSLPNLCAGFIQLESADLVDRLASRKRIILISVFLQALMILPVILIPYLIKNNQVKFLIFFAMLFVGLGALSIGPWISLMSEYIPANKRGQYFGWRNRILGAIVVTCSLFSGLLLQIHKNKILFGFWLILSLAMLSRFASWYFLTRMYEPACRHIHDSYFSFLDFIKRIRESNFVRFVFFVSGLNFSVNIAAPFFAVFMLKDLKFGYLTYTAVNAPVTITSLLLLKRWGRLADRIGNIRVIKFSSFFIASLPLLWIVNHHPVYLICVQILGGFAWSGFNLSATNFTLDSVSAPKRTRCHSYFNVINSWGVSLGAFLGGYLAVHSPRLFGYKLLALFLFSSIIRFLVILLFAPKIKEVRSQIETVNAQNIFRSLLLR